MIKHSENILNCDIRRQDTTWKYEWDVNNPQVKGTIFLDPGIAGVSNKTWWFNANSDDPTPDDIILNPELNKWPDNTDRYLTPGNNFLTIGSSIGNVHIDPIPPKFISDDDTDYISLSPTIDNVTGLKVNNVIRHFEFQFQDDIGLDFKQFKIILKETKSNDTVVQNEVVLYEFIRPLKQLTTSEYISNVSIKSSTLGIYTLSFDLSDDIQPFPNKYQEDINLCLNDCSGNWEDIVNPKSNESVEKLKGRMLIQVYDLAGNISEYHIQKEFWTIDIDDFNNLQPINITFNNITPETFVINNSIEGKVTTEAHDVNKALWKFPVECDLLDNSVGKINLNTYESGYKQETGTRTFIIDSITEYGQIIVEGWVETGNKKIDAIIKERTYNTATCGPWIFAEDGRKYYLTNYVPKYLRTTEFNDFIEWFELYLNTMYLSLDTNRNISALEKIARIGNFNDISKIENQLLSHYSNEFGNEIPFDKDAMSEISNMFNNSLIDIKDESEIYSIIKYVLEQLPTYNQFKGSITGVAMAIKMFGFTCRVVNLWSKIKDEELNNTQLFEEDGLINYGDYYMTSRFTVSLDGSNCSFEDLNNNIGFFINIIKNIKPITKILDSIKYTLTFEKNIKMAIRTESHINTKSALPHLQLTFVITEDIAKNIHSNKINLPYSSYYNIISKLADNNVDTIYVKGIASSNYNFELKNPKFELLGNMFILTSNTTIDKDFYNKLLNYDKIRNGEIYYYDQGTKISGSKIIITIETIPGTKYIKSLKPTSSV